MSVLSPYFKLIAAVVRARSWPELSLKVLPILAKYGFARVAAFLVARSVRPLAEGSGTYRVLVIEKAIFNEDALAALRDVPDVRVYGIGRAVIKAIAVGFLPRHICADDTYLSDDPADGRAKLKCRNFWGRVLGYLPPTRRFDVVLTGNWAYWAERELGAALELRGIPFIVLHKEGIKPPARSAMLRELFRSTRGQFMGRRMFVYNEDERQHQVDGGIARNDQVVVVGMARLDDVHRWRRRAAAGEIPACAARPFVLFLAFLPNNFLPSYSGVESDLAWDDLCRGSLRALASFARANPGVDVVIRPRAQELDDLARILAEAVPGALPGNLVLDASGGVMPLIERAWAIAGHNTTVLLEALATGKPVVVPNFAEALDPRYEGFMVDVGPAASYASSEAEFGSILARLCAAPPAPPSELTPAAVAALDKWTGNGDGGACARVRAALLRELEPV